MGDPAREVDASCYSPFLQRGNDQLFQLPVPGDGGAKILSVAEDGGKCLSEVLDALLSAQPTDVADEGSAVGQRGDDGECLKIEEVTVGDEDFVMVFFEIPFRN